jgi:hypothetical protein
MDNTTTLWIIIALVLVAIVSIGLLLARHDARRRSAELQEQFGPEYDRAVLTMGSPAQAERELSARTRRVEHFRFHELSPADRARFSAGWERIQSQFVDDPAISVAIADELIDEVMRARGYPSEDFEQRVADLSVEHPTVVQHYRAARALSESSRGGPINTEELRQAMIHYRFLFADLLEEPKHAPASLRNAHA